MVNPSRVALTCKNGHSRLYLLSSHGEVECQVSSCSLTINSSRVTRGAHPYVVVTSDSYQSNTSRIPTLIAIPLTSQTTFSGLPDVYPISKTAKNSLTHKSYALVHQVCTIDAGCFKKPSGEWMTRIGQLDKQDKEEINKRLIYVLGLGASPDDDWFIKNTTPALVKKLYGHLNEAEKKALLEVFLEEL